MARQPLNVREWLEDMRTYTSVDGDRAAELLQLLDDGEAAEAYAQEWSDAGFDTPAEAKECAVRIEAIKATLEQTEIGREMAEPDPLETIKAIVAYAQKLEDQSFALQNLCVQAGLLAENDHTTDPLPLLAMFLPLD